MRRLWRIGAGCGGSSAGVCETDFSGYPDCRDDTVKAMQVALNLGMERRFVLETPLDVAGQGCDLGDGGEPRRTAMW